jgi:HEAT repeat protein
VRIDAVLALRNAGASAQPAVPALITAMRAEGNRARVRFFYRSVRDLVAGELGSLGSGASEAEPALKDALTDPDLFFRMESAYALCQIDPKDDEGIAVLARLLSVNDPDMCLEVIDRLANLGARARGAIPALRVCLKDGNEVIRANAAAAIRMIEK